MVDQSEAVKLLRSKGFRMTKQRKLVLEIVQESQEHLDAETVFLRAKIKDPEISLPTVYRTLAVLKDAKLIAEHHLGEDHSHFEPVTISPHYHFSCIKCKTVIEFQDSQLAKVVNNISKQNGIKVTEVHLHLSGYCRNCITQDMESNSLIQ